MMLFLTLLFTVLSIVHGEELSQSTRNLCEAEIENILADPWNYSERYLDKVNEKLKEFSQLLFTPQANSIVSNFEREYGVTITLEQPFPICNCC